MEIFLEKKQSRLFLKCKMSIQSRNIQSASGTLGGTLKKPHYDSWDELL